MAKLSTAARNKLPDSAFAGPGRSYPVNNRDHAIAAKRLSGRGVKAGNISEPTREKIVAKANRVLGEGKNALDVAARAMARKRKK